MKEANHMNYTSINIKPIYHYVTHNANSPILTYGKHPVVAMLICERILHHCIIGGMHLV